MNTSTDIRYRHEIVKIEKMENEKGERIYRIHNKEKTIDFKVGKNLLRKEILGNKPYGYFLGYLKGPIFQLVQRAETVQDW